MNNKDLFEKIGEIDGKYIEETSQVKAGVREKKRIRTRYFALAACFVFLLAGTIGVYRAFFDGNGNLAPETSTASQFNSQGAGENKIYKEGTAGENEESGTQTGVPQTGTHGDSLSSSDGSSSAVSKNDTTHGASVNRENGKTTTSPAVSTTVNNEMVMIEKWDKIEIPQKYIGVMINGNEYASYKTPINKSYVGSSLGRVETFGYDVYTDKVYKLSATMYEIKKVSKECAVAIKYDGYNGYYPFLYSFYEFKTLGEFKEMLNLVEYMKINYITTEYKTSNALKTDYYKLSDTSVVWTKLLDDNSVKNLGDRMELGNEICSICINCPALCSNNLSIIIYDTGLVFTNLLGTQKTFLVGEEKAADFVDYVVKNGNLYNSQSTTLQAWNDGGNSDDEITSYGYSPNQTVTHNSSSYNPNKAEHTTYVQTTAHRD